VNVPDRLTPDLATRIAPDPTLTVVTYCSGPVGPLQAGTLTCRRSKAAAAQFDRLGYTDVRVYPGGKSDWFDAGLPLDHPCATAT
jgi:3-mercaptopyruvate sulfurtransferase SseA